MWELLHPDMTPEHLGFLPFIISPGDNRPVEEQINERYQHGGGWRPNYKWAMDPDTKAITFLGDKPLLPIARIQVNDETVYVYDHAYVAIVEADGSYEVARMD